MPEDLVVAEGQLSQGERIVDTFVAPSKTFGDIRRDASWWLPCLIATIFTVIAVAVPLQKLGVDQLRDGMLKAMPKIQERMDSSPPDAQAAIRKSFEGSIRRNVYTVPLTVIVGGFLVGLLFMATANFAFGGKSSYWQMVAVFWYSQLPFLLMAIIGSTLIFAGVGADTYNPMNPVGTNPGYYMQGSSSVLVALLTALDVFSIWVFALQVVGISKVAQISKGAAFGVAIIWWAIYTGIFKMLPAVFFG
jgi:hypothetical protein